MASRFWKREEFAHETTKSKGGTAGGSGAGLDFLGQRRFSRKYKAFTLKHLAQANGVKKFEKSAFLFGSRWSSLRKSFVINTPVVETWGSVKFGEDPGSTDRHNFNYSQIAEKQTR